MLMLIRALALLFIFVQVVLAQQPTPILPDRKLTPGDVFDVLAQDVCISGYTKKVRHVPAEMKREVYQEYAITSHGSGDYEVDHLIPLELGGSNSIKNLWPESHRTSAWNAQVKDRLEGKLHELVCGGKLDLKTAQQAIASNWIEAYKTYVSPNPPISQVASPVTSESPLNPDDVWVNTKSGKYWKSGSRLMAKQRGANTCPRKTPTRKGYLPVKVQAND